VGATEPVGFNTRLIFATNKNLLEQIKINGFREDLYYRISVLKINIPPLRERKVDIDVISKKIVNDFCNENNMPMKILSKEAVEKLGFYNFPGNIRELKNVLVQAILLSKNKETIDGSSVSFESVINTVDDGESIFEETLALSEKKKLLEKKYIETQLKKNGNNLPVTAENLGILINNLYRKMKELGINI
jgi:two-component system NtrC family response regulator